MNYFVDEKSIVREIWKRTDTVLLIFAGSAAEFALNKAVDWLYYTGKIPTNPLERLFSTVEYAQKIIFLEEQMALATIDKITQIHQGVEQSRGKSIPDWAYRDVLYMLIDYSIRSFELLERKLEIHDKKHLGSFRYFILIQIQQILVPKVVHKKLFTTSYFPTILAIKMYTFSRILKLDNLLKSILLPSKHKQELANIGKFENI